MSLSENRTHEATPRKLAHARSVGQISFSHDLGSAVVVLAAVAALAGTGSAIAGGLVVFMRESIRGSTATSSCSVALAAGARAMVQALAVPFAAIVTAASTMGLLQTRGLLRGALGRQDAHRAIPRLGRLLGAHAVLAAGKQLVKIAVLLLASAACIATVASSLSGLSGARPSRILVALLVTTKTVGLVLAFALVGLGLGDYLWQRWQHRRALRMSHDEVKREHREAEGDPVLKSERKRIYLELTQAFAHLCEADVVVVAPDRVAVALRLLPQFAYAPIVVCQGRGSLVSRIASLASQAGVPIVLNSDVASELAKVVEGDEIPEAQYEAVAELMAHAGLALGLGGRVGATPTARESRDVH